MAALNSETYISGKITNIYHLTIYFVSRLLYNTGCIVFSLRLYYLLQILLGGIVLRSKVVVCSGRPDLHQLLCQIMENHGFEAMEYAQAQGSAAFAQADAILLDIGDMGIGDMGIEDMVPASDGLLRFLRQWGDKTIVLFDRFSQPIIDCMDQALIRHCIIKPYNTEYIVLCIRRLIG